eukprot:871617-Pelagomonas_calceolata.AAC.2
MACDWSAAVRSFGEGGWPDTPWAGEEKGACARVSVMLSWGDKLKCKHNLPAKANNSRASQSQRTVVSTPPGLPFTPAPTLIP